jgi:putative exosortase-associated protein (TIGR04073 family)
MRQTRWSSLVLLLMFCVALAAAPSAMAKDDVYREGTQANKMFHKLGRGAVNTLTGWIEIPKNMAKQWRNYDPFTGIIVGGVEGAAWGVGRTATGLYDMVTFCLPIPEDYQPLMEPEFILPGIWGEPIPEMDPVTGLRPLAP